MLKVYFDKNVLSHILASQRGSAGANDVTINDLEALRKAVAERKIVNLLSPMHLQEAVSALNAPSSSIAQEELQLIRDLMETKQILKFPNDLLTHDIFSYARRESSSSPLERNYHDMDELFSHGAMSKSVKRRWLKPFSRMRIFSQRQPTQQTMIEKSS